MFILTSAMRIQVIPLSLRSETPYSASPANPSTPEKTPSPKPPREPSDDSLYVGLLGSEAYVPPPILSQPVPRLPPPLSLTPPSEFVLTPDSLRRLGKTVETFMGHIDQVDLAHNTGFMRFKLQVNEFTRQRDTCYKITQRIEQLRGPWLAARKAKVEHLQRAQKTLISRADQVLRSLMYKASPELSETENKWFEELRRMKQEVVGTSTYDPRSLAFRAKMVRILNRASGMHADQCILQ